MSELKTVCGTKENPCPCGWTFPHVPLATTSPKVVLKIKYKEVKLNDN